MSSSQNLAPIMPFIEPTEPIELPSVFDLQTSTITQTSTGTADRTTNLHQAQQNPNTWKGKASAIGTNVPTQHNTASRERCRVASEEEAMIERTRMELERKISELNQLKDQLAQTEQRERELALRVAT